MNTDQIICGDCLEVMKDMPDNCIDTIITDPPYGLGFMGKDWDTFKDKYIKGKIGEHKDWTYASGMRGASPAQVAGSYDHSRNAEFQAWFTVWGKEALRVAKPGAIALVFGGTRTYHRLTCAMEDAGWQIRDCMMWIFGQGFPKSLNFGCKCRGNAVPYNHEQKTKHNMRPLRKTDISSEEYATEESGQVLFEGLPEQGTQKLRVTGSEPQIGGQKQSCMEGRQLHRARERLSDDKKTKSSASQSKRLCSGTHLGSGDDVGKAAKSRRRNTSQEPKKTGQPPDKSLDLQQPQGALGNGAFGGDSICSKCGGLIDFTGYGSSLKPAYEPIVVAMKPLDGTFAQNAEKWGVAGLNIDGARIDYEKTKNPATNPLYRKQAGYENKNAPDTGSSSFSLKNGEGERNPNPQGRWPANVILDEEAAVMLDEQSGENKSRGHFPKERKESFTGQHGIYGKYNKDLAPESWLDSGGASRFFYCAKASKRERNMGCEGLEEKEKRYRATANGTGETSKGSERFTSQMKNHHPTVKPLALMEYLCKLTKTPTGGIVLDPFGGSGTTAMACVNTGRQYILIEKDKSYCEIAKLRVEAVRRQGVLF